jgi:lysophospholipase L1-like esterase
MDWLADFGRHVQAQLQHSGPGYCGIIGDSITAAAPLSLVGDKPPIKAAVNGARVGDAIRHIMPLLDGSVPSCLLLAIGVNDTKFQFPEPRLQRLSDFARDYRTLLHCARQLTPHVGIVMIGPVAKGMDVGDSFFDASLIVAFNGIIREIATEANVPTFSLSALAGADGLARADVTYDGVHLSETGYRLWNAEVERAWQQLQVAV